MAFRKATKEQAKLRLAIFGPSGAGKTFTSLRIATGLGGSIAVIDTERGSASKYADRFDFDVCELDGRKDVDTVAATLREAAQAGYDVIIIDSLSHAWQELLQEVDRLAKAKYKGNTWSAWSDGTPKQRALVDSILSYPGHVIGTMRSKTEWTTESENGKSRPVRVGLAPEQGKGIEYEFDLLMEVSVEHVANVIKDRTGKYQDALLEKPGEEFGRELAAWLSDGVAPRPAVEPFDPFTREQPKAPAPAANSHITKEQLEALGYAITETGLDKEHAREFVSWLIDRDISGARDLTQDEATRILDRFQDKRRKHNVNLDAFAAAVSEWQDIQRIGEAA